MKPRHLLFCSSCLIAAALPAQTVISADAVSSHSDHAKQHARLLRVVDSNRDGFLDAAELRLSPIALTALDLDEDGALVHGEINRVGMGRARQRWFQVLPADLPRWSPDAALMLVLDANHDGIVQSLEIANATSSLRRLDADGDGIVSPAELGSAAGAGVVAGL